MLTFKELKGRV